jgi:hypothetical protein
LSIAQSFVDTKPPVFPGRFKVATLTATLDLAHHKGLYVCPTLNSYFSRGAPLSAAAANGLGHICQRPVHGHMQRVSEAEPVVPVLSHGS